MGAALLIWIVSLLGKLNRALVVLELDKQEKGDMKTEIAAIRTEFKGEIGHVSSELGRLSNQVAELKGAFNQSLKN